MLPDPRRVHVRLSPRAVRFLAFWTVPGMAARAWLVVSSSPFSCSVTSVVVPP
jgi:hypothetical protein